MVFYVGADGFFEFAGAAWDVVELLGVHGVGYGGGAGAADGCRGVVGV